MKVPCPECKKQSISETAKTCPHCGWEAPRDHAGLWIALILAAGLVLYIVVEYF